MDNIIKKHRAQCINPRMPVAAPKRGHKKHHTVWNNNKIALHTKQRLPEKGTKVKIHVLKVKVTFG